MSRILQQYKTAIKVTHSDMRYAKLLDVTKDILACDSETTGLEFNMPSYLHTEEEDILVSNPYPFGISLAFPYNKKIVLVWARHTHTKLYNKCLSLISSKQTKTWHNSRYDLRVFKENKLKVGGVNHCTLTMSRIHWDRRKSHSEQALTEFLCPQLCDWENEIKKELTKIKTRYSRLGYEKDYANYSFLPHEMIEKYALIDVFMGLQLYWKLKPIMDAEFAEHYEREMETSRIVSKIEAHGMAFDSKKARNAARVPRRRMRECMETIKLLGGDEITLYAPKLVKAMIGLGVKESQLKEKGKVTTGADVLRAALKDGVPDKAEEFINALLTYRDYQKITNTYLLPLAKRAEINDGIVYTQINPSDTRTGRPASKSPNLLNVPNPESRKTGRKNVVRECFIARPGCAIYYFDVSQQEMAVFGLYAQDTRILEAYENGDDLHQYMADQLGMPEKRKMVKNINFGCLSLDTPILTENGWKKLEHVTNLERIWNGTQWANHDGLIKKGPKLCLKRNGIWMTPEHEVWNWDGWQSTALLSTDNQESELSLGDSRLQKLNMETMVASSPSSVYAHAVQFATRYGIISYQEKLNDALIAGLKLLPKRNVSMVSFRVSTEKGFRTLFTMQLDGVQGVRIEITDSEALLYAQNGLKTERSLLDICSHFQDGTILSWSLTELITMGTMNREIYGSLHQAKVLETGDLANVTPGNYYQAGNSLVSNCVYGMGKRSLKLMYELEDEDFRMYHTEFPSIREFQSVCEYELKQYGCVTDYFGRKYHIPVRQAYKAVNALVQGTCASAFKSGLIEVDKSLQDGEHIILPVYDEIQIERQKSRKVSEKKFVNRVTELMSHVPQIEDRGLVFRVDVQKTETNWAEKEDLEL